MKLERKLGRLFETNILIIIALLLISWVFTSVTLLNDYINERENFLTVLVDSHNDELISGNWREFLEAADRSRSEYFSEVQVCWSGSTQCSEIRGKLNSFLFMRSIEINVPRNSDSHILLVRAKLLLIRPVKNVSYLSLLFLFVICASLYLNYLTKIKVAHVTDSIRNLANSISDNSGAFAEIPEELLPIAYAFLNSVQRLKVASDETSKNLAIVELASQVSHDIRSPLAALEMISSNLIELNEEKRIVLRNSINRIRDIANNLLSENKTNKTISLSSPESEPVTVEFVATLIDLVVSEKRLLYRNLLGIEIDFIFQDESYGLFCSVHSANFKAVISNLIDNAVEAIENNVGRVEIRQAVRTINGENKIDITISDNGIGISDTVLLEIGKRGATFGKLNGNGIGLYSSIAFLNRWNGKLEIKSSVNIGTTVHLLLPEEVPPAWFLKELHIASNSTILILDDDQSIHSLWKDRLTSLDPEAYNIKLINISTPVELRRYYGENFENINNTVFLIDYELLGFKERGVDLVYELGIEKQSFLVTSRFEEPAIRSQCENLGIKIIPKLMTNYLPISFGENLT